MVEYENINRHCLEHLPVHNKSRMFVRTSHDMQLYPLDQCGMQLSLHLKLLPSFRVGEKTIQKETYKNSLHINSNLISIL
jgi:hypothetical protein